jgi:hypothetical protein
LQHDKTNSQSKFLTQAAKNFTNVPLYLSYGILLGAFCLRYLYVREQWLHQQYAELNARINNRDKLMSMLSALSGSIAIKLTTLFKLLNKKWGYGILLGAFCLRYLYVREQWLHQQYAELNARIQAMQF